MPCSRPRPRAIIVTSGLEALQHPFSLLPLVTSSPPVSCLAALSFRRRCGLAWHKLSLSRGWRDGNSRRTAGHSPPTASTTFNFLYPPRCLPPFAERRSALWLFLGRLGWCSSLTEHPSEHHGSEGLQNEHTSVFADLFSSMLSPRSKRNKVILPLGPVWSGLVLTSRFWHGTTVRTEKGMIHLIFDVKSNPTADQTPLQITVHGVL